MADATHELENLYELCKGLDSFLADGDEEVEMEGALDAIRHKRAEPVPPKILSGMDHYLNYHKAMAESGSSAERLKINTLYMFDDERLSTKINDCVFVVDAEHSGAPFALYKININGTLVAPPNYHTPGVGQWVSFVSSNSRSGVEMKQYYDNMLLPLGWFASSTAAHNYVNVLKDIS